MVTKQRVAVVKDQGDQTVESLFSLTDRELNCIRFDQEQLVCSEEKVSRRCEKILTLE